MPKLEKVTCDNCGAGLTTTGNSVGYRIKLCSERIPCAGGMVTDMMLWPDFKEPEYFCGMGCFRAWNKKQDAD